MGILKGYMLPFRGFFLVFCRFTKRYEGDEDKSHVNQRRLICEAVSELRNFPLTSDNYKGSFLPMAHVISSEWIKLEDLEYLTVALNNIGTSMEKCGQMKQAVRPLRLCCEATMKHVKCFCEIYLSKITHDNPISIFVINFLKRALDRCKTIVESLHINGIVESQDILIECIIQFSRLDDVIPNVIDSSLFVKKWVEMSCEDFRDVNVITDVPCLYSKLRNFHIKCSSKTMHKILEQELSVYEVMEDSNPNLIAMMRSKVLNYLSDNVYISDDWNLQKSRIFIRKARDLRVHGKANLISCIEFISNAIILLESICGDSLMQNALAIHELAVAYLLRAHCAEELDRNHENTLKDIRCALKLWADISIQGECSLHIYFEFPKENAMPLLCSVIDLLSSKGCVDLQIDLCNIVIWFCKYEGVPCDKWVAMLLDGRRLNHALCHSFISESSISSMIHHFDYHVDSIAFWISCLTDNPPSKLAFLQKILLCDSILSELDGQYPELSSELDVDEVKKVASSLLSDGPTDVQSTSLAGHLFYDLSERHFLLGQQLQAFLYAQEALRVRREIFDKYFSFSMGGDVKEGDDKRPQLEISYEVIASVLVKVWPTFGRQCNSENILTTWSVLRCYLESILQYGTMCEANGDEDQAESHFLIGQKMSNSANLSLFEISFTYLLGQLYRKRLFWDLAEAELQSARRLLEDDTIITCQRCRLALEVSIDIQFGDLRKSRLENQYQPAKNFFDVPVEYVSALDKLDRRESQLAESHTTHSEGSTQYVSSVTGCMVNKHNILDESRPVKRSRKQTSCKGTCMCIRTRSWRYLLTRAMKSGIMRNILNLKWECLQRRLQLKILLEMAKNNLGNNVAHEAHNKILQCICLMFNDKPLAQRSVGICGLCLGEFIDGERPRDYFYIERVAVLYNMSLLLLNGWQSKHPRASTRCCTLFSIQKSAIVHWLLKAFILSQELPLLSHKIAKLLSFVLSKTDAYISLPHGVNGPLSASHWVAYFHQASLGTYLRSYYAPYVEAQIHYSERPDTATMLDKIIKSCNLLRTAPDELKGLQNFVEAFFRTLPSIPIICISFFQDNANIGGDTMLSGTCPEKKPSCAWMLISRLEGNTEPIVMLLPVKAITTVYEPTRKRHCRVYCTSKRHMAPSFNFIIKEVSLAFKKHKKPAFPKLLKRLDVQMEKFLKSADNLWLGLWGCLLTGVHSKTQCLNKIVPKLISELKIHYQFEANYNLMKAILDGSNSILDAEACISQLILHRGDISGAYTQKLKTVDSSVELSESIHKLICQSFHELAESVNREPVIFILDCDLQCYMFMSLPHGLLIGGGVQAL